MVVSDSGCACSECVAAGAAGEARAADGVAGESSMLPWDEAGLSQGLSGGRWCGAHGFLLLEGSAPAGCGVGAEGGGGGGRGGPFPPRYSLSASWLCCWASFSRFLFFFLPCEILQSAEVRWRDKT